ncbi:hypothetical protein BU24DRAFT_487108 [Aaosphaeria arxii CBS 175.79]|uniref:Arylsulfotransferase n=1 Tax=Aaosphaeria arxii CBS 175.79 TaxID=1450172 RepID=A0A6A5Y7H3_9PLEO|nr:uncharacterized protein BU24DRAFT_487108 [Aaosphaeria arxii CBS 175.79]KAF2020504.1 hypothetical protein BU24DRAFT_487108 [Aaosphaeria arxii CBS 175.79]
MKFSPFLFATLVPACLADWQYRSRPDLSPPRLNITIAATEAVGAGFIFVAPYSANRDVKQDATDKPEQPAAYIFRDNGDLIWSSVGYFSGFVSNFQVTKYKGKDTLLAFEGTIDLLHGHGYGHATLLDEHYDHVLNIRGGNHKILDLHEFRIVDGKTALVEIYDQVPLDLSPYGGNETQKWIVDALVQELDLHTGKVLFEWHSLDHVSPSESVLSLGQRPREGFSSFDAWDYFHINSVDKDDQGNYLVSGRHVSALYKLDGKTGAIIWQLGGKGSNFTFSDELEFAFQHDARFQGRKGSIEYISLFDNGAGSNGHQGGDKGKIRDYSTGKLLALNTSDWTATLIQQVEHPDRVLGASQGNTQILPNGNFFVNWGQAGTITEFRANDSEPIFNAYLDSFEVGAGVQNYRGFRFEWTGKPREPPAIVAVKEKDSSLKLYVSWNGDTEAKSWRFYAVHKGKSTFLGESERQSFETSLVVDLQDYQVQEADLFFAESIDGHGNVLSQTSSVNPNPEVKFHHDGGHRHDQQAVLGDI